jgi:hypothetical protein
MSKVTHKNIPNFGDPKKTERQKRIDTMMAWVGMTAVEDLEPEDRQKFIDAVDGTKKQAKKSEKREDLDIRQPNQPFLSNYDYHGNFIDKVRERMKKLKKLNNSVEDSGKEKVSKAFFWNRKKRKDKLEEIMSDPFAPIREKEYVVGMGDSDASGKPVSRIQRLLLSKGYELPRWGIDGDFGKETDEAVRAFQGDNGLVVDGIVGERTINALSPGQANVPAAELNEPEEVGELIYEGIDIAPLAAEIGISPVFLEAILRVESAGDPTAIRFEPHLFNRYMQRAGRTERVPFTPAPGRVFSLTPSETGTEAFYRAFDIDKRAAIKSTSWGSGQVLGSRLLEIESDPDKAIEMFFNAPKEMSYNLMVAWFKKNPGAIKAANDLDFAGFAKIYNGPLFWQGKYDQKIKSAYEASAQRNPNLV